MGVVIGVLALVGVFVFIFFRRKRAVGHPNTGYTNTETQTLPPDMGVGTIPPEEKPPKEILELHEMDGIGVSKRRELDGGNVYGYK